ncbi:MAG: helicase HerA domain-containing protein [Chloroflexota bacterium]
MAQFVSQDSVLAASVRLVSAAKHSIDISSGWIKGSALRLMLESARPKLPDGELKVRIIYRLKEMSDLDITELAALKEFEDLGAEVRFCRRLHAKMVLVDGEQAIISSSNLTATAGYTFRPEQQDWTNYEAGIIADASDTELVGDAQKHFERIWDDSAAVSEDVVGAVIGRPNTAGFQFVLLRGVRRSQFVVAECEDGYLLATIDDISTINVSFPELEQPAEKLNSTGYNRRPLPDLSTLFTGESKEQAFLMTTTFYDPAAAFSTATAHVLKQRISGRLRMPLTPTAPGAIVRLASDEILCELQGDGEIEIGQVLNHGSVPLRMKAEELVQKHCAVYGMTGAGKSNGLKVLLRALVPWTLTAVDANNDTPGQTTRVVVIDSHGEYVKVGPQIHESCRVYEVVLPERVNILDDVALRDEFRLRSVDGGLKETLWSFVAYLEDNGEPVDCERLVTALKKTALKSGSAGDRLVHAYERNPNRFTCEEPIPYLRAASEPPIGNGQEPPTETLEERLSQPGLYILNLRGVHDSRLRARAVGWLMEEAFLLAKQSDGAFRTLFVVDEVQNFAPESGVDDVRPSLDAMLRIAREGRKFGVGLIVASQRPANVNTGLRAQCNTHLIFRLVNANDLYAVQDSVDQAERSLVENLLPQLDTGTCFACGTALQNPFFGVVPLFSGS